MRFAVTKTSMLPINRFTCDEKPCDECIKEKYIREFLRTPSDEGTSNLDDEDWFINISSLEELIKFQNDVKTPIIINYHPWNKSIMKIEIYDVPRE